MDDNGQYLASLVMNVEIKMDEIMSKHPCLHPVYPVPMSFGSGMYCVRIVFVGRNMQMIPEHSRCLCLYGVLEPSRFN